MDNVFSGNVFSTTTSSTAGTTNVFTFSTTLVPAPPANPHRDWVERTLGRAIPRLAPPEEVQRVRTYLERLGFSPAVPFDPIVARSTYRRLMREAHPDAGGDIEEAKRLTNAWNELKRRGFVR